MKYNLSTFTEKSNSTLSIHQWIRKVEIAAKSQDWNNKQQACMAQLSLEGPALTWVDTVQEDEMPRLAFKGKIAQRSTEDPWEIIDKLTARRQQHNEDVRTFTDDYTNLLAQAKATGSDIPERLQIKGYLNALIPQLKQKLYFRHPRTMEEANLEAKYYEANYFNDNCL